MFLFPCSGVLCVHLKCRAVYASLYKGAHTLSVVIHKVNVQTFHHSQHVESPGLLLDSLTHTHTLLFSINEVRDLSQHAHDTHWTSHQPVSGTRSHPPTFPPTVNWSFTIYQSCTSLDWEETCKTPTGFDDLVIYQV